MVLQGRVALETDGLVIRWGPAGVLVWIVAGDATERTALGVASALDQGWGLEADEVGACGRRRFRGLVALTAERHDPLGRGKPGPGYGDVGKPLRDGHMMSARAMTAFAADSVIAGFRAASGLLDGAKVGGMAVDAAADRLVGDRTTQVAIRTWRLRRMFRGAAPEGSRRVLGDPHLPGLSPAITPHERTALMVRAHRVLEQGRKGLVFDPSLGLDCVIGPLKNMGHPGIVEIDQRLPRPR